MKLTVVALRARRATKRQGLGLFTASEIARLQAVSLTVTSCANEVRYMFRMLVR